MATEFTDGFDKYGPSKDANEFATEPLPRVIDLLTQGEWNIADPGASGNSETITIVAPLSEDGFALSLTANNNNTDSTKISKTLSNNYGTLSGGIRFQADLNSNQGFVFLDHNTAQCSIVINKTSGLISFNLGQHGTQVDISLASVTSGTVHMIEWEITFHTGGTGTYAIYLDTLPIMSGTATTCATGSNQVDMFQVWPSFDGVAAVGVLIIDDLYIFNATTLFNNTPTLTAPRIATEWPSLDHQKQFTNEGNLFGSFYPATFNTNAPGANELILRQFTPNVNCTVNSIGAVPDTTNLTAKFKGAIYADSGGAPGALLSAGSETIGCTTEVNLNLPLLTPQALTAGTPYWIGVLMDSNITYFQQDNTTFKGYKASRSYASGVPDPAPAMTSTQPSWNLWGNCTGSASNWPSLDQNPVPGNLSCVQSSNAGDEDLYGFPTLSADTLAVYTINVKTHAYLTVTGPRTIDMRVLSGGTDSPGASPGQAPTTSPSWFGSAFDVDPNTGISWTVANANAAFKGMKVAS